MTYSALPIKLLLREGKNRKKSYTRIVGPVFICRPEEAVLQNLIGEREDLRFNNKALYLSDCAWSYEGVQTQGVWH